MSNESWIVVDEISGSARAEMVKGLLEAQGIDVVLSQEGIGDSIYPLTVGSLSNIQILVSPKQVEAARQVLSDYSAGVYENIDYSIDTNDEDGETGEV